MKFFNATSKYFKFIVGRMLRETGLALDHHGSRLMKDIAYLEPLSRHRNIMNIYDLVPKLLENSLVAPNSTLIGEVVVGKNSIVWYGATLRGDNAAVRVGSNTSIGDYAVLETVKGLSTGVPSSTNIGNFVNIGNNCSLYSCVIDDYVTVGPKSVIAEGAVLERGCVIAPGSYVPPGKLIPAYQLWEGTPVSFVRELKENEQKTLNKDLEEILNLGYGNSLKLESQEK